MKENKKQRDPRTEVIPAIWGIATGIIVVGSVFAGSTDSGPVVPVLAVIGATISSCVVWLTGNKPAPSHPELEQAVVRLSQRVAQLEIDVRDQELRHSIQQSVHTATQPHSQQNQ